MKNIFDLTKREQRLVIMIVAALVTAALAKHFWGRCRPQEPTPPKRLRRPGRHPRQHLFQRFTLRKNDPSRTIRAELRNRHRDHEHVAQFTFHAIAAGSASQRLEYGLVHSNASLEIFQWKIFIRRMRPAILQRETDQQRFDAKNISKVTTFRRQEYFESRRRLECSRLRE